MHFAKVCKRLPLPRRESPEEQRVAVEAHSGEREAFYAQNLPSCLAGGMLRVHLGWCVLCRKCQSLAQ